MRVCVVAGAARGSASRGARLEWQNGRERAQSKGKRVRMYTAPPLARSKRTRVGPGWKCLAVP